MIKILPSRAFKEDNDKINLKRDKIYNNLYYYSILVVTDYRIEDGLVPWISLDLVSILLGDLSESQ